ncbi:cytochrome c oxidase subunit 3 [Sinobacterium caligoides]|uniref:Cytochrome c oxidase subunit 3 n=1 Tax=Sinobacterium caligoides TaxID=933926 RepID=A0A3N2DME5_9GAMM|nr:cytochrome c oxidase subunit 3 [Sinobacterium caligoides]ROS00977.1 cytochrome c oxidase subunit 3 [Sinobacterium caligoides]
MLIFKALFEKPWLDQSIAANQSTDGQWFRSARTALMFFITVVSVVFFLLTITYLSRSQYGDFQALAADPWSPLSDSFLLWVNCGLLMLASLLLHLTARRALVAAEGELLFLLCAAIFCTLLFVLGQWQVWLLLIGQGFFIESNPANSYFYLLTALHALHLIGGLLALLRVLFLTGHAEGREVLSLKLKLCAWYWHYLLLLWLFLFTLLTADPETYNRIAAWCGF